MFAAIGRSLRLDQFTPALQCHRVWEDNRENIHQIDIKDVTAALWETFSGERRKKLFSAILTWDDEWLCLHYTHTLGDSWEDLSSKLAKCLSGDDRVIIMFLSALWINTRNRLADIVNFNKPVLETIVVNPLYGH
jgi:hypothetical protein